MGPSFELLRKYNVPVPRYTSYPTVPYWNDQLEPADWQAIFKRDFNTQEQTAGIALYIHLPFCEKLCTYCGCNKKITTNHSVEAEYISAIHNEWNIYRSWMGHTPVIRELHLGGGTPTFFSPENLEKLLAPIFETSSIGSNHEFSFEGHPNNTTREHLETLYRLGFRRVSFGVQDTNAEVQRIINRVQPFRNVVRVTDEARSIGYESVNFDLIYGLPRQTQATITDTITQVISLKPDRVAFYSYAHVPWTSRGQRLFDENDLPSNNEKLSLYHTGRKLFNEHGYEDIGMDHFALPHDELCVAMKTGKLHRNFMGYTTSNTDILVGLGVSAISSVPDAYAQNEKTIHDYYRCVNNNEPAVKKGYVLTHEDRRFARYIKDISCFGSTDFDRQDQHLIEGYCLPLLEGMQADGLVHANATGIHVTAKGRNFIRNICSAFDLHMIRSQAGKQTRIFSKAI